MMLIKKIKNDGGLTIHLGQSLSFITFLKLNEGKLIKAKRSSGSVRFVNCCQPAAPTTQLEGSPYFCKGPGGSLARFAAARRAALGSVFVVHTPRQVRISPPTSARLRASFEQLAGAFTPGSRPGCLPCVCICPCATKRTQ